MYLVEVGIVTVIDPMCDIGAHSHKKTLLEPIVVHCPMTLLGVHVSQILVMLLYCL